MPLKRTIEKAQRDKREGKSASTQAGEFVREEIDKIRHGEHGARSAKQAIAIGLSEARRAGVDLPPPARGRTSERTRKSAEYGYEAGQGIRKPKRNKAKIARGYKSLETRTSHDRIAESAVAAGEKRRVAADCGAACRAVRTKAQRGVGSGQKSRANTQAAGRHDDRGQIAKFGLSFALGCPFF